LNKNQTTAYVLAQTACALAEIEGMKAENMQRAVLGQSMAYDEAAFQAVIERYGIHHNGVITMFNSAEDI